MVANRISSVAEPETRREVTETYPRTHAELFPLHRAVLIETDHGQVAVDVFVTMEDGYVTAEVYSVRRIRREDWSLGLCFSQEDQQRAEQRALELV
jgi:hypothetical protein